MTMPPVALFLLQALIVIGLPYALWRHRRVRAWVPLVVVQITVGIALGPSVLGAVLPAAQAWLFPDWSLSAMNGLVWLALVFFAFATGLHFDLADFRGRGRAFATLGLSTVIVPTGAGVAAGLGMAALRPELVGPDAGPHIFAVAIGIAVGVTALPVLGAILRDMRRLGTPLGSEALGCAAVNDAALWVMVAVLLVVHEGASPGRAAAAILGGAGMAALLWCCVRPGMVHLLAHAIHHRRVDERDLVVMSVLLLGAALAFEMAGLHAVIGAFALGAVMPREVARDVLDRFESFLTLVLLPFFFISTGLRTDIAVGSGALLVFVVTTPVALAAKLASAAVPARIHGAPWNEALALGALVGCKGLMELVVLTLLLEAGILSEPAFSGMVLMALATTALARPVAARLLGPVSPPPP